MYVCVALLNCSCLHTSSKSPQETPSPTKWCNSQLPKLPLCPVSFPGGSQSHFHSLGLQNRTHQVAARALRHLWSLCPDSASLNSGSWHRGKCLLHPHEMLLGPRKCGSHPQERYSSLPPSVPTRPHRGCLDDTERKQDRLGVGRMSRFPRQLEIQRDSFFCINYTSFLKFLNLWHCEKDLLCQSKKSFQKVIVKAYKLTWLCTMYY